MMPNVIKTILPFGVILLACCWLWGCSGGDIARVGNIEGPDAIYETTHGYYKINYTGTNPICSWYCNPPEAGYFENPTSTRTKFIAGKAPSGTVVELKVLFEVDQWGPALESKTINIMSISGFYVSEIEGPAEMDENPSSVFNVYAGGDTSITYKWSVDPPSAGVFDSPESATTEFTAAEVSHDTHVQISVFVTSDHNGPIIKTFDVAIMNISGLQVGEIEGPNSVEENSSATYSVEATGDTGITYQWSCIPPDAGQFSAPEEATTPFLAGVVDEDTSVEIQVEVNSDRDGPILRSKEITVEDTGPDGWVHTWGGSGSDWASSLAVEDAGNSYVTGGTLSFGAGGQDVLVMKYDSGGNVVWTRTWGGGQNEKAYALALYGTDSIYVAGDTWSFGAGGEDIFILKYSADGDLIWQKTWGGSSDEVGQHKISLAVDAGGNVYLAGDTRSFGLGETDIILLKYNSDGGLIWEKTWGGSGIDQAPTALAIDNSGYIYLACRVRGFGSANSDTVLLKYTPSGSLIWQRMWGGSGHDYANAITLDDNGNVYITGVSYLSFGAGGDELILYKYDSDGNLGWRRTWGGASYDGGDAIAFDGYGNLYVGGITRSYGVGGGDIVLLKYSLDGDLLLQKTWGESPEEAINDLAMDGSGNLYIAGKANNISSEWQNVSGQTSSPSGTSGTPSGSDVGPNGIQTAPMGIETTPDGIEDTGGGDSDVLVMRIDPASL